MKIAFMFPGQGAQTVGMGKDIYEKYKEAKNIYEKASEITGVDIAKLCFETDIDTLSKTENTQIAIATMSLSILEILKKENINAEIAVGLSLGEYPALIYGGYLSFNDGMKLLKQRGYLMGNRVPKEEYSMAAVIGLESNVIEEVCKDIQNSGMFVTTANYNYSGQTVISGLQEGIDKAIDILKQKGAKKVVKLKTGGPFHTIKLEEAKKEFIKDLDKVEFKQGSIKVIKNIDGTFYNEKDNMKEILSKHIVSPVRFDKAIELMINQGIDTFVEIGPGKALSGFIKKENKDANIINICDVKTLENAVSILKGE